MGLSYTLFRASSDELRRIGREPDALEKFVESIEGPPPRVREVRPKGIRGLLLRLSPVTIWEPDPTEERPATSPDPQRFLELEEALIFLVSGTAESGNEPGSLLWEGGEVLDDDGIYRALAPEETERFANYLSTLSPSALELRFDPTAMRKRRIQGVSANRSSGANVALFGRLVECFAALVEFTRSAAARGDGMIIRIG